MRLALLVVSMVMLSVNCAPDDGMTPHPAKISFSGCKLKSTLSGYKSHSDPDIQMGEAWANPRILYQKSAFFVAYSPNKGNCGSEGGPYGKVLTSWPKPEDMVESNNPADWCYFWDGTLNGGGGKKQNATMPKTAPGKKGIPMPIVCPHNLKNCYSAKWYDPGGKLAKYGSLTPTYDGIWFPLKDPKGTPIFCQGLNLGCPTPTMLQLQLHKLAAQKCDVSKCKKPKGGS